jgi:PadR family transcriptional regulator PadR
LQGYAIAQLIQQLSDDLLRVEEDSLYPALQRLELNGWITGERGLSANNRRARSDKLTPDGRKQLAAKSARHRGVTGAVAWIMGFAYGQVPVADVFDAVYGSCSPIVSGSCGCGKRWSFTSSRTRWGACCSA